MANESETVGPTRLLLVDDDRELCAMLSDYLSGEQFVVSTAHDGAAGLQALRAGSYAAVVLDITMPVMDGFECLRQLRAFSRVPVIMLTARGDEVDRIVGLEIGADDYLPKPFNPRELLARLRAILRRGQSPRPDAPLITGDLTLDSAALSLLVGSRAVALTATEFGVLEQLARSVGQVVNKAVLSEQVLGRRLLPFDRSLDTHVARLRKKLGPRADGSPRIRTVRGQGYLLVQD